MAVRAATKGAKTTIPQLDWHRVEPAPVVLVTGPEELLAERAIRAIREKLRAADPSLEVSDIDAGQYAPGELLTLASPSLFAEPRLIRVSQVEKCTDAFLEETLAYLEAPADDTVLVLRHGGGVRGKKLLDAIRAGSGGGVEVVCAELKREGDKIDFAAAEFRTAQRKATPGAVRALVSAFTDDLAELAAACRQLVSDTDGDITEAVVDRYYAGRTEVTAFAVADAAIAGRPGEALGLMRHALASGSDPVPMVAAFAMKIRTMAKLAGARGSSNDLARQFGLQSWQVDRARRDLQGWTDEGLARAIEALADADAQVKGAGRDPVYALERMIAVIAARGAAA
ncbi:DNA polymerase III subunit delta [Protaetiibacter mangrovi]|uniref:DNA-directed DNA polymerase n=1 Tax=Protaetiibacter mangrovi TaxID=2970926 RepID=A0ABT1ZEW5_9MICO|nr:DNA polymerase III subunit delta [Protaetiibacter mangrovi]MCS0499235.1 DNA polymerase III subunit delta [Protaetiibacter mangrovi]TPX04514.1 DNA polymerase III subunit delta [Schumannella luteola]